MKFTVNIEDKCDVYPHQTVFGDAFALDNRNRHVLIGGNQTTSIINLNEPHKIAASVPIKAPFKWNVTNYEWDMFNSLESDRYLQTRNKIIEIIDFKSPLLDTVMILEGHARQINQAKWAPFKRNVIASSSPDSFIMFWDVGKSAKPELKIQSAGEVNCLAWHKTKEDKLAVSSNNDIRLYDIRYASRVFKYLKNAHHNKIYSIDWCGAPGEDLLISTGRDKVIKLWNFNMINEQLMEKLLAENPWWKAKFTPFNLCFGAIQACPSNFTNPNFMHCAPLPRDQIQKMETYLITCQIVSLNDAKVNKIISNQYDLIVDFDFYTQDELLNVVTWSRDQHLRIHGLDMQQFSFKSELDQKLIKSKIDDDLVTNKQQLNTLHQTTNTTNSSRKSSFSENLIGTSPNFNSLLNTKTTDRESSFNLIDEHDFGRPNSQNYIKPQTNSIAPHEFLKKNPKCFGAKFSGLPEQFILFNNEGVSVSNGKTRDPENGLSSLKRSKTQTNGSKQLSKQSKLQASNSKNFLKRIRAKVLIFDISNLVIVRRDLAEKYSINAENIENLCNQNIYIAAQLSRFNIIKIWELLKFITYSNNRVNMETFNPDFGQPWSCSTFGRTLINNLINNCVESNDIQTAAMIISKLKLNEYNTSVHRKSKASIELIENPKNSSLSSSIDSTDENTSSIFENSTISDIELPDELASQCKNFGLLDPARSKEFDLFIRTYCNLLYKWGLFNKRIEMLEFVTEKPKNMDSKFECFKRCVKCSKQTNGSKCCSCKSYTIKCSLCELPVNGLALYCSSCGCGGHYDHLIDWFKRHDDCPSACGCRCIDYL